MCIGGFIKITFLIVSMGKFFGISRGVPLKRIIYYIINCIINMVLA